MAVLYLNLTYFYLNVKSSNKNNTTKPTAKVQIQQGMTVSYTISSSVGFLACRGCSFLDMCQLQVRQLAVRDTAHFGERHGRRPTGQGSVLSPTRFHPFHETVCMYVRTYGTCVCICMCLNICMQCHHNDRIISLYH